MPRNCKPKKAPIKILTENEIKEDLQFIRVAIASLTPISDEEKRKEGKAQDFFLDNTTKKIKSSKKTKPK